MSRFRTSALTPVLALAVSSIAMGCVAEDADAPVEELSATKDSLFLVRSEAPTVIPATSGQLVRPMHAGRVGSETFVETSVRDMAGVRAGSATYVFDVVSPGSYDISLRVQSFKPNFNSLFFELDGAPRSAKTFVPTNFAKDEPIGTQTLTAGRHQIVIRGRAQFTRLHSIHLVPRSSPPPPPPPPPPPALANFTSRGGRIYAPDGSLFQPRGMNVDEVAIAEQDIEKITTIWKANIIRLSPYNAKDGVPTYDPALLGRVVDAYTRRKVVVEIGDGLRGRWGDTMEGKELADHAAYYRRLATQFKDNPWVWFASPNEQGSNNVTPGSAEDAIWLNEEKTINEAIRGTGSHNLIVQGDVNWGQGAASGGRSAVVRHATELLAFGDMIASVHVYNNRADAQAVLTAAVAELRSRGFAVVADEFGSMNGTIVAQAGANAVFRVVEEEGIGMLAFRWYDVGPHAFTANGRGNGARTAWGNQVWDALH